MWSVIHVKTTPELHVNVTATHLNGTVTVGYGIANVDKVFEILQCPSDPYKDGQFHYKGNLVFAGSAWSVTNYLGNWHVFNDSSKPHPAATTLKPYPEEGFLWGPSIRIEEVLDGTSQSILFGEAYSRCEGYFRLALWGDSRIAFPTNPTQRPAWSAIGQPNRGIYPSHTFGLNWVNEPNTQTFQTLPKQSGCNSWRVQGMHLSGLNVAMVDGSVRSLRKGIHRQEITDPDVEGTMSGVDPSPRDIYDGIQLGAPLGVWDRLVLPRDGEVVQATEGSGI